MNSFVTIKRESEGETNTNRIDANETEQVDVQIKVGISKYV